MHFWEKKIVESKKSLGTYCAYACLKKWAYSHVSLLLYPTIIYLPFFLRWTDGGCGVLMRCHYWLLPSSLTLAIKHHCAFLCLQHRRTHTPSSTQDSINPHRRDGVKLEVPRVWRHASETTRTRDGGDSVCVYIFEHATWDQSRIQTWRDAICCSAEQGLLGRWNAEKGTIVSP